MESIINRAVQLMQHHLKISSVTLDVVYKTPDTTLLCDENQIQQALVALMVNAVEAMPGGGSLNLTVARKGNGDLEVLLADSGAGIAPEDVPHIFEPFFSTKKEVQGVGLGLSVVYGIIERHGGTISVKSELGRGTVFAITFPPTTATQPAAKAAEALPPDSAH
jgi:two-component system NtrC family sensor kinase